MATVLVVDDQENVRRSMVFLLEQDRHRVIEADGVGPALHALETAPVDVVVTDVRLRGQRHRSGSAPEHQID